MTQTQEKNVPKLRFPEFEEVWGNFKFGNLYNFVSTNSLSRDKLNYEIGDIHNIHYGDIHTRFSTQFVFEKETVPKIIPENLYIKDIEEKFVDIGDLIIADASEDYADIGKAIEIVSTAGKKIVAGLHTIHATPSGNSIAVAFAGHWTKSMEYRRQVMHEAQGAKVLGISARKVAEFTFSAPTLLEQRKIAGVLDTVEEKIGHLSRKKALLDDYKKACMQQLFSQKIRFKNDNGNDFPDWEEKRLGWVFEERKTYMSKGHDLPHVSLTVKGVVPKSERYERDFLVRQEDKQYKITYENDICYNPANLKFGVICRNKFGSGIFSPIYCTFEVAKEYDPRFVEALITSADFIKRIRRYEEGTVYERMAVKPADFILGIEKFPHLAEQRKIADFLSALDRKIELVSQELTHARSFKAGLLQQMFV
jgi:type I restriction enzyme S subunit